MRQRLEGKVTPEKVEAAIKMIREQYNTYHENAARMANDLNTKERVFKIERDLHIFDLGTAVIEGNFKQGQTTAYQDQCAQKVRDGHQRPTAAEIEECNDFYRKATEPFQEPNVADVPPQTQGVQAAASHIRELNTS